MFVVRAPTSDVLSELAETWSLSPLSAPPAREACSDVPLDLPADARARATTRLLTVMGLHDSVRERLANRILDAQESEWAAEAAWTSGQYLQSAEHWAKAKAEASPDSEAITAERRAAALWLRGELRRAKRELLAALAKAESDGTSPRERLVMAETLGRIIVHMGRLPDTRVLVRRGLRQQAIGYLDSAMADLSAGVGVQMRARVDSVRAALTGDHANTPELSVQDFNQSEALLAMLNYRHAQLRERAAQGERVDAQEYRQHASDFRAIGAFGDAVRVPLLPGGETAFEPGAVWRGFGEVDFTTWHRMRLFAGWMAKWAIAKAKSGNGVAP